MGCSGAVDAGDELQEESELGLGRVLEDGQGVVEGGEGDLPQGVEGEGGEGGSGELEVER